VTRTAESRIPAERLAAVLAVLVLVAAPFYASAWSTPGRCSDRDGYRRGHRGSMRGDPEDPLGRRLGTLVREWPDLARAAEVYRVTLPLLRNVRPIAAPIPLTEDQARRKLAEGHYLLHGVTLVFDQGGARGLMLGLARNLEEAGLVAVSPIRSALEGDRLVSRNCSGTWRRGITRPSPP